MRAGNARTGEVKQKVHSPWSVPFLFYRLNASKFAMTARVKDILDSLNTLAPFKLAESWDNVGLLVGNPDQEVTCNPCRTRSRPTVSSMRRSASAPTPSSPIIRLSSSLCRQSTPLPPKDRLLEKALTNRIAIIGYHTNFDSAPDGVSAILARATRPGKLGPAHSFVRGSSAAAGLGRIGSYRIPSPPPNFLQEFSRSWVLTSVQVAGSTAGKNHDRRGLRRQRFGVCRTGPSRAGRMSISRRKSNTARLSGQEKAISALSTAAITPPKNRQSLSSLQQLEEVSRREKWNIRIMETKTERHPFVTLDRNTKQ